MTSIKKTLALACAASVLSLGVAFAQDAPATPDPAAAPAATAASADTMMKKPMKKPMKKMSKKKMMKKKM